MSILLILIFIVFCVSWICIKRETGLKLPPLFPGAWPILGHNIPIGYVARDTTRVWGLVQDMAETVTKNGGVMRVIMGFSNWILITDPEDMLTASNACLDKPYFYGFGKCWLGDGLLTGSAATWKRHRKIVMPSFNQQILDGFMGIFNSHATTLVRELKSEVGQGHFHHFPYLNCVALESIFQTAIGLNAEEDIKCDKTAFINAEQKLLNIITHRFLSIWLHSDFIYNLTSIKKKQDEATRVINDTYSAIIKIKKSGAAEENQITEKRVKSFMDLLLDLASDGSLTDEEVWEEVNTIIVAGHDTVATTLVILLIILGSHQDVQVKIFQELKDVFGDSTADVTKNDLPRLIYMDAVIKETLRVYPIGLIMFRCAAENVKLKNYSVPAGTPCGMLMYGMHRHPVWGEDAEEFRPERWLEDKADKINAFAGFGVGKRNCIGRKYAMMFSKTILSHVLRRYRITADISKLQLRWDVMLKPASGDVISIEERNI